MPDPDAARLEASDRAARRRAVDPRFNVSLEASAGTGKTRVLVDRFVNLLRAGVDPANVLAITFTRKAAAEMRDRVMAALREGAARGEIPPSRWRVLRDRTADLAIGTIDAFCLSLLVEFPLEADLDPGFQVADDTEVPRLIDESLDRALRVCRLRARDDEEMALVFAQLGDRRARAGLAALLERRLVVPAALARYVAGAPPGFGVEAVTRRAARAYIDVIRSMRGGVAGFLDSGPVAPAFLLLGRQLLALDAAVTADQDLDPALLQAVAARLREHFLTQEGRPRRQLPYPRSAFASGADWTLHRSLLAAQAPAIADASAAHRRDLNMLVARGAWRMFSIAAREYERTLDAHGVLDFPEVLRRATGLLAQMEEFSRSRFRLESRYHHVLVDEFQDTSRAQWELVSLLVRSWGEGAGLASTGPLPPSIFIVGDRKQSIYGFRDADVSLMSEAGRYLSSLRPEGDVRRSISHSFRSVPAVLAFVNDVCQDIEKVDRPDAFRYGGEDRFPVDLPERSDALGVVVGESALACARRTAAEIARLLGGGATIRDRQSGLSRPPGAGDVAILFRTRESHREFQEALEERRIPAYVYRGLGFFDADEIKDVQALLWYLADPLSDFRAAAFMRSRLLRLSDEALRVLAPALADALLSPDLPPAALGLGAADRAALTAARRAAPRWRGLVDRIPPAELLDAVLAESACVFEMRGPRFIQAWENLKKVRALVRRAQNRGYATLARIAAHLDRLALGDESNAVVDAVDAVHLTTIHAAKGLEFPVVFLVNLTRGTGRRPSPIRVASDAAGERVAVAVGEFQSDADADESARDREETKRLLYVALTRARDRLYLAAVSRDGALEPARGSLAEVMPRSLVDTLAEARAANTVGWRASSGAVHVLRACQDSGPADLSRTQSRAPAEDDFQPVDRPASGPRPVSASIDDQTGEAMAPGPGGSGTLEGSLVHRLVERLGIAPAAKPEMLQSMVRRLLRAEERAELEAAEVETLVRDAALRYEQLSRQPEVQPIYSSGEAFHEVPFTFVHDGARVRGRIDCLVRGRERVTILEFKTGRRLDADRLQLEVYERAVSAMFPHLRTEARLVYVVPPGHVEP
jgi:ATP-dependent helicase/nuclease subunit A